MLLELFFSSPMLGVVWLSALLIALTVHEFSHAIVGKWRGDDTAEQMGRLTLNPLAHLDPLGTIMLLIIGIGWAKPVPFAPNNLKNPLYDGLLIALAGPASNLILAIIAGVLFQLFSSTGWLDMSTLLGAFLVLSVYVNMMLMVFNLIPINPLDGSKVIDVLTYKSGFEWVSRWLTINGPKVMLVLVVASLVTPMDPFFFIHSLTSFGCNHLLGTSCTVVLGRYF